MSSDNNANHIGAIVKNRTLTLQKTSSNLARRAIQDIERLTTDSHVSELIKQMAGPSDWKNNINEKTIKRFRDEAELDGHYKRESPKAYTTLDLRHPVIGKPFDCHKAVSWIIEHAQKGDANFQCILGIMYMFGSGVVKDYKLSEYWLRKSVEQGLICAQTYLGECYFGWAVDLDLEVDSDLFIQSIYWTERAAEQGNLWAQILLAECFSEGLGVKEDQMRAVHWSRKAADQGDVSSQYSLGWHYNFGKGVEKNYELAAYWYEKSAAHGDHVAQYHLGLLYLHGHGVEQSETKSKYWIEKSGKSSCFCEGCKEALMNRHLS